MGMFSVRDVTLHILHLAEKAGIDNIKLKKSGVVKIVFLAVAYCYKYGMGLRYDILFYKTARGAANKEIENLLGERYGREVSYRYARELGKLAEHKTFDRIFSELLKKEEISTFAATPYIINTEVFQGSKYAEKLKRGDQYNIYENVRDEVDYWTLEEIFELAGVNRDFRYDFRIPVSKEDYGLLKKYIWLQEVGDGTGNVTGKQELFSYEDIIRLRRYPQGLLDVIEVHGIREV